MTNKKGFKRKWLLALSMLAIILLGLSQIPIVKYGIGQLKGQVAILWNAEKTEKFLQDPEFPDSLKFKISLIQAAKDFAVDSLGLEPSGSYQKLYDQKGRALLWVVTAAPAFSLEAHKWSYPFLGELEYKGFFDSTKAANEADRLMCDGFDVRVSEVEAWSTLGFFNDPILSNMLEKEDGLLARLIIHELTHGTIYIESDAELNENLATFIGNEGAYLFLENYFGQESKPYAEYQSIMGDIDLFAKTAIEMRDMLQALYTGMGDTTDIETKKMNKKLVFQFAYDRFKRLPLNNPSRFNFLKKDTIEANNTFFSSLNTYHSQQDSLHELYEEVYKSDLRAFIRGIKEAN